MKSATQEMKFEDTEIIKIAKYQRVFIYFFLGIISMSFLSGFFPIDENNWVSVSINLILLIAKTLMGFSAIIVIYCLAKALKKKVPFLYAFPGMFLPLVNLVVMVHLVSGATKVLKARGLKVGIMGCKIKQKVSVVDAQ